MSLIHAEPWDGASFPSDWTAHANYGRTSSPSGLSPISSPDVLQYSTGSNGTYALWWNTVDSNGGDVAVSTYAGIFAAAGRPMRMGVLARSSNQSTTLTGTDCYAGWFDWQNSLAGISKVVGGTETTLFSLTPGSIPAGWIWPYFHLQGTSLGLAIQRQADGFWLQPGGSWAAGSQVDCVSGTDATISGAGYAGIYTIQYGSGFTGYGDNWEIDTYPPAVIPPLPFAGRSVPPGRAVALGIPVPPLRPPAVTHRIPPILSVRSTLGRDASRPVARIFVPPAAARSAPRLVPSHPRPPDGRPDRPPGRRIVPPIKSPAPPPTTPTPWALGHARVRSGQDRRGSPPGSGGASRLSPMPISDPPPIPGPTACGCCAPKCTCNTTICVQGCGGARIVGATVNVAGVGTCITRNISTVDAGCCNFCLPGGAGTYTVTVTAPGYNTYTGSQSLACDGTITITLTPAGTAPPCVTFHVYGCCSGPIAFGGQTGFPLAGATITISGGPTLTTDVNGFAQWCGPTLGSSYAYTVSKSRYADSTGTIDATSCSYQGNMLTITMLPAAGFVCLPWSNATSQGAYPVPTTLHLTDSIFGGCVLTWDPADFWWRGTISGSFIGGCGCPPQPCTLTYRLTGCSPGTDHSGTFGSLLQPGFFTASCSGTLYGFAQCAGLGAIFTPFQPPVASCPTSATGDPLDCAHAGGPGFYGPNLFGGGGQVGGFLTDAVGGGCLLSKSIAAAPPFSATISWFPPGAGGCNGCGGGAQPPGLAWSPGVTFTITE